MITLTLICHEADAAERAEVATLLEDAARILRAGGSVEVHRHTSPRQDGHTVTRTKIHYSGGLEYHKDNHLIMMGRGYPACCSGDRAVRIRNTGNQTDVKKNVTCRLCLDVLYRAADRPGLSRSTSDPSMCSATTMPLPKTVGA